MDYFADRSWMYNVGKKDRMSESFGKGVKFFIKFGFDHKVEGAKTINCPCVQCKNMYHHEDDVVEFHLVKYGFTPGYTNWFFHGESRKRRRIVRGAGDDMQSLVHDALGISDVGDDPIGLADGPSHGHNDCSKRFEDLLETPLYPECNKFSKLSFMVRLFQLKCLNGWTDNSFAMLLELLKEVLPDGNTLPEKFYEFKKIISELGLDFVKIHACRNDCMLFWKENEDKQACTKCKASRWKSNNEQVLKKKKVPVKVLRYFPLIPRLKRIFMSKKTAELMTWHETGRKKDDLLRHPADTQAWKELDKNFPWFGQDPRNVRLGLASDGFNPFGAMNISYSTWPVILMPYNLPPWLCMKQPFCILSMLIEGPKSPGNDIDVYLQPLIDELNQLWTSGVETYDASKEETFQMHAAVLWTINDFPALGMLSGWKTKGYKACPTCNVNTHSVWLRKSRKVVYGGHRKWLSANHAWRRDTVNFDGSIETNITPKVFSGSDVLNQCKGLETFEFGKFPNSDPRSKHNKELLSSSPWKKKSIFFNLPYWKTLLIRHNLDPMHIEKNVCDNFLNTFLSKDGKSKDNINARLDLQIMNLRPDLHPKRKDSGKFDLPPACYSLTSSEKEIFLNVLKNIKVPDGFSSRISNNIQVKERKIIGLKSHDCHVLMQQLLPLAVRGVFRKSRDSKAPDSRLQVGLALNELSSFFRELCSKVIDIKKMEKLERSIAVTLCKLERIFPPAFFDIMVHLVVHLAREVRIAGPVHYRWMYPVERYLSTLKRYVRNRSHPEGSISVGYISEECANFFSGYLDGVETKLNRPIRNSGLSGHTIGKGVAKVIDSRIRSMAHRFVLFNTPEIDPYIEKHKNYLKIRHRTLNQYQIQQKQHNEFITWFKKHVDDLTKNGSAEVTQEIKSLSIGPVGVVKFYEAYTVNGYRFHTRSREQMRVTQNSGIVTIGQSKCYANARDNNPIEADVPYYGVLTDVLEFKFTYRLKIVLFMCEWYDIETRSGMEKDEYGYTRLNTSRRKFEDDPFIFPSNAEQVYYSSDPVKPNWSIVLRWKPRDFYDKPEEERTDEITCIDSIDPVIQDDETITTDDVLWVRSDVESTIVDASEVPPLGIEEIVDDEPLNDDADYYSDDEINVIVSTD